jgi:phosphoglycolate phosphatase
MITHLFFDLDGTLVDSLPGIEYSARAALAEVLPGCEPPDFRPFIGPPIQEIYRRALGEENRDLLGRLERAYRSSYDSVGWQHTRSYPGVPEVLKQLVEEGYFCMVLTNKPRIPCLKILENLKLACYFKAVMTPDSREPGFASKAEAALQASQQFGLSGPDTLLVGDSLEDAATAAACGFFFAGVTFGYGDMEKVLSHAVHFLVNEFTELPRVIQLCSRIHPEAAQTI